MTYILNIIVVAASLFVFREVVLVFLKEGISLREKQKKFKLIFTGFIANVADTLGIGSFAVVVALNNRWKFIDDKKLPGTLNAHALLPAMLQSLLFLHVVDVDILLLTSFVISACIGACFSSFVVSRLNKQTIRLLMSFGFFAIALLIFGYQFDMLPISGAETSLSTSKLIVGIPAMMLAGMLPAIGMGIYVPIQVIMFLLGFSPLVAFPVMTTAGSLVQATTAYVFIKNEEVYSKESLILGFAGVLGVLFVVPFVTYVNLSTLRWLLLCIVIYNAISMWQTYQREKKPFSKTTAS